MNIEPYRQILTRYWGFTSFKPLQEEIIKSVAEEGIRLHSCLPVEVSQSLSGSGTNEGRNLLSHYTTHSIDEGSG